MPQYEKYEGESQEAADARIAKNKQANPIDVYDNQFKYLIDNLPEDSELGEIIGWDDGRYEVGLYAVRTKDGIKFVGGDTDRYHGYGKSGNPKYESSADAKYGSAKHQIGKGKFLSYDEAFKIYKRQAKREKPGIAEKVMKSLSNYFGEE